MRSYPLIIFLVLIAVAAYGNDFRKVDSYSRTLMKSEDYRIMAKKLTEPFETQQDKVRAIFVWITDNVSYDFAKYQADRANGGITRIYGRTKKEIDIKRQKIKQNKIIQAYKRGKGVCEDYSFLFEAMCQTVGIDARTITGYARFNPVDIGKYPKSVNHAWNSVKIDDSWYLLDATWAAGTSDFKTGKFIKKFQEGFFLTDPSVFILNHFPEDTKWQLLPRIMTFENFTKLPFAHDGFYDYRVSGFSPQIAFLDSKQQFNEIQLFFKDKTPEIVVFENNYRLEVNSLIEQNVIRLKIPTKGKINKHIIVGIKNGNYFDPILEYKIR